MMRSLSSAVAGLRSHQTKMDVIGNNIANVNTYGFKGSRTTFSDVFYQNLTTGSGATSAAGGTNPTQIGYGASVATIDVMNTVAGSTNTDHPLDVYLAGEGFLVSKDSSGKQMFTRLGNLDFDGQGNLVDGNGQFIQGFPQNDDGSAKISADGTIVSGELKNIKCDPEILNKLKTINISKTGAITGTMPGEPTIKTETLPPFLNGKQISIPNDSTLQGDVKLMVGALPKTSDLPGVMGVTGVEFGDIALPLAVKDKNEYSIEYDDTTKKVTFKDDISGATYVGYVKDGKATLTNPVTKKTAMTLTLAPTGSVTPATKVLGDMDGGSVTKVTTTTVTPPASTDFPAVAVSTSKVTTLPANTDFPAGLAVVAGSVTAGDVSSINQTINSMSITYDGANTITATVDGKTYTGTCTPGSASNVELKDTSAPPKTLMKFNVTATAGAADTTTPAIVVTKDPNINLNVTNVAPGDVEDLPAANPSNMMISYDGNTITATVGGKTYTGTKAPGAPATAVPLRDASGKVLMNITVAPEAGTMPPTPMNLVVAKNPDTVTPGAGFLKYEVTTSDKGDNIVKIPATTLAQGPQRIPTENGKTLMLDGLMTIQLDTTKGEVEPFSGSIGMAGPGDAQIINIGNIVLAKFRNPGGMLENGSSYFEETFNSGGAIYVKPSLEGTGEVNAGFLELSNVDVSKEFTDMITTQRGFQANSRIITVSDSMLEELVNLKR